jgi:hypothetical protein
MKICLSLVHLITSICLLTSMASAQTDPPQARITSLNLDPQIVSVVHLRSGYVSSVRVPEEVSSVVLGDPGAFKAEHSDAEPQLVFFKPMSSKPAQTNALITTRSGHEISLSLVSQGSSDLAETIDYVLKYERQRSFLIAAAHSSFTIAEVKGVQEQSLPIRTLRDDTGHDEDKLLNDERINSPGWQGKLLRVAVGHAIERGQEMTVAFSVFNASAKTIELLPPQIQLAGVAKGKGSKNIKAEPVAIKEYRMNARRLEPKTRADGVVVFERPAFKESRERLLLEIAQAEEVDKPVLVKISFVALGKGGRP